MTFFTSMRARRALVLFASLTLSALGCGTPEPRFAAVDVSSVAPTATLSGRTSAAGVPAIALSPGCPGFVDPSVPEHVLRLVDASAITISARSLEGPVSIAVVGAGEVRCDADGGSGHVPSVTIGESGDYLVYVGALATPADYGYELHVAPAAASDDGTGSRGTTRVAVTITSDPSGASVRTPEGDTLGSTPVMFAIPIAATEVGSERRFILEMPGRSPAEVSGRLVGGTMVLHATLVATAGAATPDAGPSATPTPVTSVGGDLSVTATVNQPITDYRTTTGSVNIANACAITRASVGLDIAHSYVGDLRVTLVSPRGTEVVLHDHGGAGRHDLSDTIEWDDRSGALHTLAGETSTGTWEVRVRDDAGADTGTFRGFTLRLSCDTGAATTAAGGSSGGSGRPRGPRVPRDTDPDPDPWAGTPIPGPVPGVPPIARPGERVNGGGGAPPTAPAPDPWAP